MRWGTCRELNSRPVTSRRLSPGSGVPLALLAVLACRLAWAALLVPAFQHPDEPQHLAYIATLVEQRSSAIPPQIAPGVSQRVISAMAANGWWAYYGRPTPAELPATLEAAGLTMPLVMPRAYYVGSAWWLRLVGVDTLMAQYWTLRVLSALLGIATAAAIWAGCRRAFGRPVANGTLALLAFHPQFALVSTAVNPDVVVNLAGALVWWQAARAIRGPARIGAVALAVVAAAAGALSKRLGLPLLIMAALVAVAVVLIVRRGEMRTGLAHSRRLVVAVLGVSVGLAVLFVAEWSQVFRYAADLLGGGDPVSMPSAPSFEIFTRNLGQSAWLNAGWLTVPAQAGWYRVAFWVSALALGALPLLPGTPGLKGPALHQANLKGPALHQANAPALHQVRHDRAARWLIALAVAFVVVQTSSVYAGYFRAGYAAQGRYLFPVIGPFLALVWIGATWWTPRRWRRCVWGVLVAVMVLLDFWAWTMVIVPGFAR